MQAVPNEDPYRVLGVEKDVRPKDLKRAFRRCGPGRIVAQPDPDLTLAPRSMALKFHPDRNPSADAQAEFIRIAAGEQLQPSVAAPASA